MTESQQIAAALLAGGKLKVPAIAEEVGVTKRTIFNWQKDKEFQAEVKRVKNAWRERAQTVGMSDPDFRLRNLNDRHRRLRAIINQRAKDPQMKGVAGGNTGLLTVTYKMQSQGEGLGSARVPEYSVDVPMLQEMREIEIQSATEKGQWKAKASAGDTNVTINVLIARINAGRARLVEAKRQREAPAEAAR